MRLRPRDAGRRRTAGRRAAGRPTGGAPGRAARRHGLFVAGSVPELGDDGSVYDTALVFDPRRRAGRLAPQGAPLPARAREHAVFAPGDRLTTFDDPALGRVGVVVGFDGDFPEVARSLALRGARLVLAACACEVEAAAAWDLLHPALRARQQPVVAPGEPGGHARHVDAARCEPHHRPDRHRGRRSAARRCRAGRARPSSWCTASTCTWRTCARGRGRAARGRAPARALRRAGREGRSGADRQRPGTHW